MASDGTFRKIVWNVLTLYVVVAFSCQPCCSFVTGHGGRFPTQQLASKSKSSFLLAEPDVNQSKEKWILLVEDEEALRSATGKYLANEGGYQVTGVADARSAIMVCHGIVRPDSSGTRFKFDPNFNQQQYMDGLGVNSMGGPGNNSTNNHNATQNFRGPDCLVLDIRLGKTNGLELLKIIRSDPILQGLPVVLLTAKGKVEDRILGYEVGADAYLPKPFDPEELLSIINGLMVDKFSVRGGTTGRIAVQSSDNADDFFYDNLKHELREIKSLMQELGFAAGVASSQSDNSEESWSPSSLHGDLLEVKENLKQIGVKNIIPPQNDSTAPVHQHSQLSILTPEETEIMINVAQGMTSKDVATKMQCSISKIDKRLSAMCKKAKVKKRVDLVTWWQDQETTAETISLETSDEIAMEEVTPPGSSSAIEMGVMESLAQGITTAQEKTEKTISMETSDEIALEKDTSPGSLSAMEMAVMESLVQGMTTDEIISNTRSTKRKIVNVLNNLFKIANVNSRTDLVRWWEASRNQMVNGEIKNV